MERSSAEFAAQSSIAALAIGFAALYAVLAIPAFAGESLEPKVVLPTVVLAAALATLSAIDGKSFRLPDVLTLPLVAVGFIVTSIIAPEEVAWHALAAALGGSALFLVAEVYARIRRVEALGFGDVKLFAAAGAWVGLEGVASVLLVACGSALAYVTYKFARGAGVDAKTAIPFGPFIALGTWMVWLYGPMA